MERLPEMPKYRCHKVVRALRIGLVELNPVTGEGILHPTDAGYTAINVTQGFMDQHRPGTGGYYVKYEDGYKSYRPAKAIKDGYTLITDGFDFGMALQCMKEGRSVTRKGWNGPGQSLHLQTPDEGSKMTLPYIYIQTVQGDLVPWLASQTDMLATDWREVEP